MASGRSGRRGIGLPGITKTQAMRQAKAAAFVKGQRERDSERERQEQAKPACCRSSRRSPQPPRASTSRAQPATSEFAAGAAGAGGSRRAPIGRPGTNKTLQARIKHAQRFRQEMEEKKAREESLMQARRRPSRRSVRAAGRERTPSRSRVLGGEEEEEALQDIGLERTGSRGHGRSFTRGRARTPISRETCELARSINADVIQAEPVAGGPVQNIVIPPGAVDECRTTIISVPRQNGADAGNRSIRALSVSLNEQEAAESAAVNDRLTELQQARRDFVMTVANVGGNAAATMTVPALQGGQQALYRIPDVTDDYLQIQYDRNHPDVVAAREYASRNLAASRQREAQLRMQQEFRKLARESALQEDLDLLRFDVPTEQELMEADLPFEEDEETGMLFPCASRFNASMMPPIPTKTEPYYARDFVDVDDLERFFDLQNYPSCEPELPPPGRENLNPDLWCLDDPWYHCPPCDEPDLIDFND